MTCIYENMIKKPKNVPKMRFLELKCAKNGISKFDMMLCLGIQKSCKNCFDMIFLPNSINWHHSPKTIDRLEISTTPRASKGEYMMTPRKYSKKQRNIFDKRHFF